MSKYQTARNVGALISALSLFALVVCYNLDDDYWDLAVISVVTICSFLIWIVFLLIDLNAHFEKLEESDD